MQLTREEKIEVNNFSIKYPTIYKQFQALTTKVDELEKELNEHKKDKVRHDYH